MTKGLARSLANAPKDQPSVRRVSIPMRALAVAITDPGAAVGYGTAVIAGLPEGNILLLGAVANVMLSSASAGITATFTANFAVGTAATADATLSGNEVNVIPSTATSAATAKVSPVTRGAQATAVMLDNTDSSLKLNMNITVPDASLSANSSISVDGVLHLAYVLLGDD
jgi:hypothetical protein